MSIFDKADEIKDEAEKIGIKLAKAVNILSGISGDDNREDIFDAISEAVALIEEVVSEIY